jgi:hypothetical protein
MQSEASRILEWLKSPRAYPRPAAPYEVDMARLELASAIEAWTAARKAQARDGQSAGAFNRPSGESGNGRNWVLNNDSVECPECYDEQDDDRLPDSADRMVMGTTTAECGACGRPGCVTDRTDNPDEKE